MSVTAALPVIAIVAIIVFVAVFLKSKTEVYKLVTEDIKNAETLDGILIEYSTRHIVTFGE